MLSRRLAWEATDNPLARALAARRRARLPVVDLTEANPTRVGLPYPEAAILQALAPPGALRYEPDPRGLLAAREAVAREYERVLGARVDPARIVLTAGTSEAYGLLLKVLCDPGDTILVPEPSYPLFEHLAGLEGVGLQTYRLDAAHGFALDVDALALAARAAARPRAVVLVAPHNPTGAVLGRDELRSLDAFCASRGLALVADEVFAGYAWPRAENRVRTVTAQPGDALTFALGGLSKWCGLPQLKLGWIVTGGPAGPTSRALSALELAADAYLTVATPVQLALERLLALGAAVREAIRHRVRGNRRAAERLVVAGAPASLLPAEGGWSAVLRVPATRTDEAWALALLEEDGVLVHPGYFYDMPEGAAYLVAGLLAEPGRFQAGLERLLARVHSA